VTRWHPGCIDAPSENVDKRMPGVLADPQHRSHGLFEQVRDVVSGACGFCARAFEAEEHVHEPKVPLLEEYHAHPSIRRLVDSGYRVITF
jgi:hypothetical protein